MGNIRRLGGQRGLPVGMAQRQTFAQVLPQAGAKPLGPPIAGGGITGLTPFNQTGQASPVLNQPGQIQTLGLPQSALNPPDQRGLPQPGGAGFNPIDAASFSQQPATSTLPLAPQPQFGLSGAEQSFQGGALSGASALQTGQQNALQTLLGGFAQGQQQLGQGIQALQGAGGQAQFDPSLINQGQQALQNVGGQFQFDPNLISQGVGLLGQAGGGGGALGVDAAQLDTGTGQGQFQQGVSGIQQFQGAGLSAQQRQAALTGALGPQAQQQAQQGFLESPGQVFAREQALQDIVDQSAATGGIGGGRVLEALQSRSLGLTAQNQQQNIQNLAQLSGQGLQAAGQAGQLLGQSGALEAGLAGQQAGLQQQANVVGAQLGTQANIAGANRQAQLAQAQAGLLGQGAGLQQQAGLANQATQAQLAQAQAGLLGQGAGLQQQVNLANQANERALAQSQAGLFGQGAGLAGQLAGQGAGIQAGTGQNIAQLLSGAGQQIGGARLQAGRDISGATGQTAANLANLISQQGGGLSDIIGSGGANIANLLSGAGQLSAGQQTQLAALLSNLATGQGSQLAGIQGDIGTAQAGGITGRAEGLRSGIGRLAGLF